MRFAMLPLVRRTATLGLILGSSILASSVAPAQQAAKAPLNPREAYAQFRAHYAEGKYDVAALFLQAFLDGNPSDKDLLEIENRYGSTVFSQLATHRKWSDDAKLDQKTRQNVKALMKKLTDATDKVLRDPARVSKYIHNLGETEEERQYAIVELRRTGDFAIPFMVEAYRANLNPSMTAGIREAIPSLSLQSMGGWIAALDGFTPEQRFDILAKIVSRPDALQLTTTVQTDFRPYLWRLAGSSTSPNLRKYAKQILDKLVAGASRKLPEAELTRFAQEFADRQANYLGAAAEPNGSPSTVSVWTWNEKTQKLVKQDAIPTSQSDEYYGLRYARWALEKAPDYEPAQSLLLSIAADRAMDRGKFGELAKIDPVVYRMMADAPSSVLSDLLEQGLVKKRTGVVLALVQVIGDRAEKGPALPTLGGKPSLLARALDFGDPRVQLAAANALLRSPAPLGGKVRMRIIEVLRRAAGADAAVPQNAKGQALIADPNRRRGDEMAGLMRSLGYDTEVFASGRELLKRTRQASDFDVLVIDHHIVNPQLRDVISDVRGDRRAARRPILVVASSGKPTPPSVDQLLLHFALLIAATETDPIGMPAPYVPSLKSTEEERTAQRKAIQDRRDNVFRTALASRVDRLRRVLETTGLELTDDQKYQVKLRTEQVTSAVLAAEYPLSAESAPRTYKNYQTLLEQIGIQPGVPAYKRRVGVDQLLKLIERLELDVAKAKASSERYEYLRRQVDAESLGLRVEPVRDEDAEARLAKELRSLQAVRVIPEPASRYFLATDLDAAFQNPADRPRDPAEKKAAAKLAIAWLAKMATGEVPGFDAKLASTELLAALRDMDNAETAIDGVARFPTAQAQQGLLSLALTIGRPLPTRVKAADAAIRHVQIHGKLTGPALVDGIVDQASKEPDADLKAKLLVLKGLLAPNSKAYVQGLRNYSPPLVPPKPMGPAPKPAPKPKK